MLPLLGREARRSPIVGALVRRSIDSGLGCQSRLFGTSDLCIFGHEASAPACEARRAAGGAKDVANYPPKSRNSWEAWRWAVSAGRREGPSLPLKAWEALQGLRQATTGLHKPWAFPVALLGAIPFALPGLGHRAFLPQSLERDRGYEDCGGGEGSGEQGARDLFEGVHLWATSVKRKRVTKMRKHKWRKRRRVERQSAARRAGK